MNYDEFINRWYGKSIDWDGQWGAQCVDEIAQYCVESGRAIAYANAKDWFQHPALEGDFDCITNNPNDYNQVPKRGDIIIWSGGLPGSGGYGHIAIFDMVTGPGTFQSLDQNWGGQYVHWVQHNWGYILGWLTPKVSAPAPTPAPAPEPHPEPTPVPPAEPGPFPAPEPQPDPVPPPVVTPVPAPVPEPTPQPIPDPVPVKVTNWKAIIGAIVAAVGVLIAAIANWLK